MPGFRIPSNAGQTQAGSWLLASAAMPVAAAKPLDTIEVDKAGHVIDPRVTLAIRPEIEHAPMSTIDGIIVHQTGASTAKSSLDSYLKKGANGAHFLIDKDGTIYQTASVFKTTHHVGQLKSRCRVEMRCTPQEVKALAGKGVGKGIGRVEAGKAWPGRFPGNSDSLGVEFASGTSPKPGGASDEFVYETVTARQQGAFDWLLPRLLKHFHVKATEIFRHPDVSWKQPSEGASVRW